MRIAHGATGPGDHANAREALRRGRQAANLAEVPLMVHVSDTPIPLDEILNLLRAGDIATHIFNGNVDPSYSRHAIDTKGCHDRHQYPERFPRQGSPRPPRQDTQMEEQAGM